MVRDERRSAQNVLPIGGPLWVITGSRVRRLECPLLDVERTQSAAKRTLEYSSSIHAGFEHYMYLNEE